MAKSGWETDYKVPGNPDLRVTLFWGDNYFGAGYKTQLDTMRAMLKDHGIRLDTMPTNGSPTDQFTVKVPVKDDGLLHEEDHNELRNRCAAKYDDQKSESKKQRLPVIFCQFQNPMAAGLTVKDTPWLPFCLVGPTSDSVTILHEAGHAGGLGHLTSTTKANAPQSFMFDGGGDRSLMHKAQLQKLVQAYFIG